MKTLTSLMYISRSMTLFCVRMLASFSVIAPAVAFMANASDSTPYGAGAVQADGIRDRAESIDRIPLNWKVLDFDNANAQKAWKIISDFHQGKPAADRKLYAVYVSFKDRPMLSEARDRYDRILKNIQAYYSDQMQENGFPGLTFALELENDGKIKLHEAYVDRSVSEMTVDSSGPVSREAATKVLQELGVDPEKNHIFIVCQLPDGVGPYYGGGFAGSGTGWTCDQEGLDTREFKSTKFFGGRYHTSYGQNATIYIGGTAHELGHSFGLPHTRENANYPRKINGVSLMGEGNFAYANDLRNEGLGAFLSPTDAMMLASVPLFNGVETGLHEYLVPGTLDEASSTPIPNGLRLQGKVSPRNGIPVYAVIAHLDPPGGDDYDAPAYACVPEADGHFSLDATIPGLKGQVELRLTIMYADGTRAMTSFPAIMEENGISVESLQERVLFSKVIAHWDNFNINAALRELDKVRASVANDPALLKKVDRWQAVLLRKPPVFKGTPAQLPADVKTISLVDCEPELAQSGWEGPCWDHMAPSSSGLDAFLNDCKVDRFIMNHANGKLVYDLASQWDHLQTRLGVPTGKQGTVQFVIYADGKEVFSSNKLTAGESVPVELPLKNVNKLTIELNDFGDGNASDWGVIVNPLITR